MSEDLQAKYQEAIKAMQAGGTAKARRLLNEILEEDEEHVDAWVALSKVVDNEDEKRICLTTILQLDPANSYARRELAKSEEKIEQTTADEEVAPGITRRMMRTAIVGSTVFVLVVFAITLLIVSAINGDKSAQRQELTQSARNIVATDDALATSEAAIIMTQTMEAITQTAQAQALITPTLTPTRTLDPAFATWTPTPTESTVSFRVLEPPPANVPGFIVGWGGRDSANSGYFDPFRIRANDPASLETITTELTLGVTVDVPGQTILFERYNRRIDDATIAIIDPLDPETSLAGFPTLWSTVDAINIKNPKMSADGSKFVVEAEVRTTGIREIFLVDINTNEIIQITNDNASYRTPALSLDGTQILATRQDPDNGTDLVLIDVETLDLRLMTDDGDALIESHPSWHQDGIQAVFKAHPAGLDNNSEIYSLRILPEASAVSLLIATNDDETHPVYDPNSQFIAFASNRGSGVYNIYIFDLETLTTYQLTEEEFDYFPGGWSLS